MSARTGENQELQADRKRPRFPNALVLLMAFILLAGIATYLLPAGRYERVKDESTGRTKVVANSYHRVEQTPVGPLGMLSSIQQGMISAASVIFFVFLVGGAFTVIEQTGALAFAVESLVSKLETRPLMVIPIGTLAFASGGATFGMMEETIAFIPILVLLARRLGFDALTGVSICFGGAVIGAGFGPLNPFNVGIAQSLAELPLFSGMAFRIVVCLIALALLIHHTARHARRARNAGSQAQERQSTGAIESEKAPAERVSEREKAAGCAWKRAAALGVMVAAFAGLVIGVLRFGWGIDELATLFFTMGIIAGIVGGLGINGTAEAFILGFQRIAFGALLIGFARAILVVLEQGAIIDTMVAGLVAPLEHLPGWATAIGMLAVQSLLHFPVPSTSGQAMITMPILVPLSDLLGIARQVTVLAYQYGAGIFEMIYPTNGAMLAVIAIAGISFDRWLRFMLPLVIKLWALAAMALLVAISIGVK